jgi:hypothetical protein
VALVAGAGVLVVVALVSAAPRSPLIAVVALPILGLIGFLAVRLWRVGVYERDDGIAIGGLSGTSVLPWDEITAADVDAETYGFEPLPTVVLRCEDGSAVPLSLLNERSLLMLGSPGGVQGLADRINEAVARHRTE